MLQPYVLPVRSKGGEAELGRVEIPGNVKMMGV